MYVRTPTTKEMEDREYIENSHPRSLGIPTKLTGKKMRENLHASTVMHALTVDAVNESSDKGLSLFDSREQDVIDDNMLRELVPDIRTAQYASRALKSGSVQQRDFARLRRIFGRLLESS